MTQRRPLQGSPLVHVSEATEWLAHAKESLNFRTCNGALQALVDAGYAHAHADWAHGPTQAKLEKSAQRLALAAGRAARKWCRATPVPPPRRRTKRRR